MLVLSRKQQQQIKIGEQITVTILRVCGNTVRVGIQAPREVRVIRGELPKEISSQVEPAAAEDAPDRAVEIGAIELVVGSDEPGDALDEAANSQSDIQPPVVTRAPQMRTRRDSTFPMSRGPLSHLVAGSAALAK